MNDIPVNNPVEFLGYLVKPQNINNVKLRHVIFRSIRLMKYDGHWDGQYVEHDKYGYSEYSEIPAHQKYSEYDEYKESVEDY